MLFEDIHTCQNNLILKWYYDESRIFPTEAILKQTSSMYGKKNAVYFLNMQISQVVTSYT